MRESPFSSRVVALLIACATALAAAAVLLHVYGKDSVSEGKKFANNAYSVSAIGHAGFYDLLRRMDRPALRSAGSVRVAVGTHGTLIIAEPNPSSPAGTWRFRLMETPRLLFVLPKWSGAPDENRPSWISKAELLPLFAVRQTLALAVGVESSVFRRELTDDEATEKTEKKPWPVNNVGVEPTLSEVVQLIRCSEMMPIVGGEDGILLGEIKQKDSQATERQGTDGIIWVLSDPDVLSNHGIVKGDNAAFMLAAIDALRSWNNADPSAPIVFDETIHGFRESQGSTIALPFRFPFVVVTALTCIAVVLLVLSGAGRFGTPLVPKPVLDFGKMNLIGNSARLLDYSGHHAAVLERYIGMTLHSVASALRAPYLDDSGTGHTALSTWLDRVGRSRGVSSSCSDILRSAKASDTEHVIHNLFESAKKIYDWKQEILKGESVVHGYSIHQRHR